MGYARKDVENCECERCKETEGKNLLGKALMEVRSKLK